MIKYITLFIILISSCNSYKYPAIIVERDLISEYELAKYELYLKYLNCLPENKQHLILEHDFIFWGLDSLDGNLLILFWSDQLIQIASESSGCKIYNGIGFKENEVSILSIENSVMIDYKGKSKTKEANLILTDFYERKILNPWLRNYVKGKMHKSSKDTESIIEFPRHQ